LNNTGIAPKSRPHGLYLSVSGLLFENSGIFFFAKKKPLQNTQKIKTFMQNLHKSLF